MPFNDIGNELIVIDTAAGIRHANYLIPDKEFQIFSILFHLPYDGNPPLVQLDYSFFAAG